MRISDWSSDVCSSDLRYTLEMAEAVRRLQADHGIKADGVVGADTLQVLNTGAAGRARQLAVNLELRRWLNRTPPATRIDVNTAAATLDYWHDGIPELGRASCRERVCQYV